MSHCALVYQAGSCSWNETSAVDWSDCVGQKSLSISGLPACPNSVIWQHLESPAE